MTDVHHVTTSRAVSTHVPGRVRVDERDDLVFTVSTPDAAETDSLSPEQLYAASLASCLHQAIAVEATKIGAATDGSQVHATVDLTHNGSQRFGMQAQVTIELPDVDENTAARVRSEAMATCPLVNGVEISTSDR
ncbi:OsmC family protein [Haloactinomyces albus]|uniref:Organic hydroperoxide reductase OsmC/OhrA n=1 Tax=Haloactinomyces albus TaxID=1352928 RepID=A0AAE3ZJ53_9ACTN|nr:OsmC family protein [Haloactinomyces albus]MDR7304147.1 organic hydroperoxide reductase OsmC/OhrA [Haloactinomyces albus]